eukprot:Rmarinus@m.7514
MVSYAKVTDRQRSLIIEDRITKGLTFKAISNKYQIKYGTVYSIYRTFEEQQRVHALPRGGRKPKLLNQNHLQTLAEIVEVNPYDNMEKLRTKLAQFHPEVAEVSDSTMNSACKSLHFTWKKVKKMVHKLNNPDIDAKRALWKERYFERMVEKGREVVFIDEMGINLLIHPQYGRSRMGKVIYDDRDVNRGSNITAISAISPEGPLRALVVQGSVNNQTFVGFLAMLFGDLRALGIENAMLVMDNVSFHRHDRVTEAIEASGHERVLLPPYSPNWNAIEYIFSPWKHAVGLEFVCNQAELVSAMARTWDSIPNSHCTNAVMKCYDLIAAFN